ncbi:Vacuolar protein-sorting-associated protein 27 [Apophysomyces sp. BC1015]|nr:Vacuolar protein-sorting-associated protein 27 [Apophysomyces sp. BC1015]
MVSLWWNQSTLDEQVEKATSELLPAGQEDIALHLEISDQIRSKKVNAKDAMRTLKQRMGHKNPNVQLLTLSLVDTCVKNGGDLFVREVSSREFMNELASLVRVQGSNADVKDKALLVIQMWGMAAKGNPSISYMTDIYDELKAEGYTFPHIKEHIDPMFLKTSAVRYCITFGTCLLMYKIMQAPEWTDSDHHCRQCGGTFCQQCSSKTMSLLHHAINEEVRVCDGCYIKLKLGKDGKKHEQLSDPAISPSNIPSNINNTSHSEDEYDDDMKKVIELSLREAEQRQNAFGMGYTPSKNVQKMSGATSTEPENDDLAANADLAAAIAASLREMEIAAPPPTTGYESKHTIDDDNLSAAEMENMGLFSTLIERAFVTGGDISNDSQIRKLYEQMNCLQPKLLTSLDRTIRKHVALVELHRKLDMAVRTFDRILEERVSGTYSRMPQANKYNDSTLYSQPTAVQPKEHSYPLYSTVTSQNYDKSSSLPYINALSTTPPGTAPGIDQLQQNYYQHQPYNGPDPNSSNGYDILPNAPSDRQLSFPGYSTAVHTQPRYETYMQQDSQQPHKPRPEEPPLIDL